MPAATLEPTAIQLQRLAASGVAGPILMLNLLRFNERAGGVHAGDGISGREACSPTASKP